MDVGIGTDFTPSLDNLTIHSKGPPVLAKIIGIPGCYFIRALPVQHNFDTIHCSKPHQLVADQRRHRVDRLILKP